MVTGESNEEKPLLCFNLVSLKANSEFSVVECSKRYLRALTLFYFQILSQPAHSLIDRYVKEKFYYGHGWLKTAFLMFTLPAMPLWTLLWSFTQFYRPTHFTTKDQGEGIMNSNSLLSRLIHWNYMNVALAVTEFYTYQTRMTPVMQGETFSKDFWRGVLTRAGNFVPPLLARWEGRELKWKAPELREGYDIVVKDVYGGLGSGDAFFKYKEDFTTKEEVQKLMEKRPDTNPGSPVPGANDSILLERVYPIQEDGKDWVHCLRINTVKLPDGTVRMMWLALQCDSSTFTSHNGKRQYRLDPNTGTVLGRDQWFRNRATWGEDPKRVGTRLEGAPAACRKACQMHQEVLKVHPRRYFISWDAMFTKDGEVWFEGNTSAVRMTRFIFCSWGALFGFIREFAWGMMHRPIFVPLEQQ